MDINWLMAWSQSVRSFLSISPGTGALVKQPPQIEEDDFETGHGIRTEIDIQIEALTKSAGIDPFYLPPEDWARREGWDQYSAARLLAQTLPDYRASLKPPTTSNRIWFAGCGLDVRPLVSALDGNRVVATDVSKVAVAYQGALVCAFNARPATDRLGGTFTVEEGDFTDTRPDGVFDWVVNCAAFQGLSADNMRRAAEQFYAALRPGGRCSLMTWNVGGKYRERLEESLRESGFVVASISRRRQEDEETNPLDRVASVIYGS